MFASLVSIPEKVACSASACTCDGRARPRERSASIMPSFAPTCAQDSLAKKSWLIVGLRGLC